MLPAWPYEIASNAPVRSHDLRPMTYQKLELKQLLIQSSPSAMCMQIYYLI